MMRSFHKDHLPRLGVGISFRTEMAEAIATHLDQFDFLELIVDTALSGLLPPHFYAEVAGRVPVVAHGVNASLGSLDCERVDTSYLSAVASEVLRLRAPWFSEHLAFTRAGGVDAGQLLPLQRTSETIAFLAAKIRHMRDCVGIPVLVENLAYYFEIPGAQMTEAEFVTGILESADCGLLLDVNNLHANAVNHEFDAIDFLDRIPEHRVVEVHVAGGDAVEGLYIDTHGHPVNEAVLELLDHVCRTKRPNALVLEREKNLPDMAVVIEEVRAMRAIWDRHCPLASPAAVPGPAAFIGAER